MKAPSFLKRIGKAKWKTLLAQLGQLQPSEYDSLALLCSSWELYLLALEDIHSTGTVIISKVNGRSFVNPNVNVANEAWKQIVKLSRGFGLQPETRAMQVTEDDDKWDSILPDGE